MKRTLANVLLILVLFLSFNQAAVAQPGSPPNRPLPASLAQLKMSRPITNSAAPQLSKLQSGLMASQGPRQVIVRMAEAPVAEIFAAGMDLLLQRNQLDRVRVQQESLINRAAALDPTVKVLGSVQRALNAVMLEMDAAELAALAADPAVESINPVIDYHIVLTETIPYIGGTAVQGMGFTGKGVRVAVMDSGIDYLHSEMGGSGDPAEYAANDPSSIEPETFPTAKVVGGYDFVGEAWTGDLASPPLAPDPDPLDLGIGAGHGTHVADIIAGRLGVAPDAELYALKVCSSISTACSGVALLEAMDFALDPDGDGSLSDHVDIINMSLGSDYGLAFDDDLSHAVNLATRAGVLTVAASGNGQDKPFITSTPAAAPSALSVAQTQVPSAVLHMMELLSPAEITGQHPAVHQSWSPPLTEVIEAPVQYGDGAGGNLDGCAPFVPGSLAGKIVLVDRGACNFTLKIKNIGEGGALAGVIGLIAPGEPFVGGDGGDRPITVPGFMIRQSTSDLIKSQLEAGVTARFDPATALPLVMQMAGTSSRGPAMRSHLIKPEIGAPGGSVSAEAGTGTGMTPFSGTSGAAPMVAGSAALLKQANPDLSPQELKAILVNTAETNIMNTPPALGGGLAPISRIGGGEVRVDRAAESPAAAWDSLTRTPALSFGFHDVTRASTFLKRDVSVRNYSSEPITYAISASMRFEDDTANGAVQVSTLPSQITVEANSQAYFLVTLTIDGTKLREWGLNSGPSGSSGDTLTVFEYDGYVNLDNLGTPDDDSAPLHLPWQVLARQAANVRAKSTQVDISGEAAGIPAGTVELVNRGIGTARIDTYSLIGTSEDLPEGGRGENAPVIDLRYVGAATFPVPAGFCSADDSFVMSFAVNTWERQTHANAPAAFEFDLDTNRDGVFDYAVFNFDAGLPSLSDGRNVTWVQDLTTGAATAMFFTDHGTNSGNTVLTFCAEQIGMNAANFGQQMDLSALAIDFYYSGQVTDVIDGITIAPLGERYLGTVNDIPSGGREILTVLDFGPEGTNPSETGVLLLLDAPREGGIRGGAPARNEAIAITVNQE